MRVLLHIPAALAVLLTAQPVSPQATKVDPGDIPQLTLWRNLKHSLEAADGASYFESNIKDALLPGGAMGVQSFVGKVLSSRPEDTPKELILAMSDTHTPEVILRFEGHLKKPVAAGTNVAYMGVRKAFTREPFISAWVDRRTGCWRRMAKPSAPPGPPDGSCGLR